MPLISRPSSLRLLVLAALHVGVPLAGVIAFAAPWPWALSGAVFAAGLVLLLGPVHRGPARVALALLSGAWMLAALMLLTAWYMQGSGFSDAFFYHLDLESLRAAWRSYGPPFALGLVLLAAAMLLPLWPLSPLSPGGAAPGWIGAACILIALSGNAPLHSLLEFRAASSLDDAPPPAPGLQGPAPVQAAPTAARPAPLRKNIVLVYAESLERLYFDRKLFGELLPGLRALAPQAHQFTNMRQVRGTGWTIAGIVASQCGFPLLVSNHLASNSSMASNPRPFPGQRCLADRLRDAGYHNVFMGGATLAFAGKGNFLRAHGYQEVMGQDELLARVQEKEYLKGWGLYDDTLLDLALERLDELQAAPEPYFLTVLTLDTHHPRGEPSRSCERLAGVTDPMSQSIHCSDQLISRFLRQVMARVDMEDTVVALFSDHLSLRNTLWKTLQDNAKRRRLTFMLFDDRPGSVSRRGATHFDVAPTLLEAALGQDNPLLGRGSSLLSEPVPDPQAARTPAAPRVFTGGASVRETGARITPGAMEITVGDLALTASANGHPFKSGMFMAVFDEVGQVVDAVYSDDFERLQRNLDGVFVIGISRLEGDPGPTWFAGRLAPRGEGMWMRPLTQVTSVPAEDIVRLMDGAAH